MQVWLWIIGGQFQVLCLSSQFSVPYANYFLFSYQCRLLVGLKLYQSRIKFSLQYTVCLSELQCLSSWLSSWFPVTLVHTVSLSLIRAMILLNNILYTSHTDLVREFTLTGSSAAIVTVEQIRKERGCFDSISLCLWQDFMFQTVNGQIATEE